MTMRDHDSNAQMRWHQAWAKAWGQMPPIPKTHKATIQSKKEGVAPFTYTYADLPDIIDGTRPALSENGFGVSQSVVHLADGLLGVETRVYHEAGWVEVFGPTPMAAEGDPRTIGSAITYARRYALAAALGVASDEDTDAGGTEGTGRAKGRQNATSATKQAPGRQEPSGVGDSAQKATALKAVTEAYPGVSAAEAKRLCGKHWVEATVDGLSGAVDRLLALVANDPERPM